jgi:hypothetical protein
MLSKPTKMILLTVTLNMVLLSASSNIAAQERSPNQTGCTLIDKSRPAQFISYEGTSETRTKVTLRLHNNTSCSIIVETDDRSPTQIIRLPNRGVRIETVTSSRDEVMLPLHYLVQDRRSRREPETAYGWGDSVYNYEILGGQSAFFTVPLTHFRKRFDLAVPFNYAWEGNRAVGRGAGGVIHRVYFLIEDLPEALRRKR